MQTLIADRFHSDSAAPRTCDIIKEKVATDEVPRSAECLLLASWLRSRTSSAMSVHLPAPDVERVRVYEIEMWGQLYVPEVNLDDEFKKHTVDWFRYTVLPPEMKKDSEIFIKLRS